MNMLGEPNGGRAIPVLPNELLDTILGYLRPSNWGELERVNRSVPHDPLDREKADLMACHGVSRVWRENTRRHLFADLSIIFCGENPPRRHTRAMGVGGPLAHGPGHAFRHAPLQRSHRLPDLRALSQFLNDSPAIAVCIRRLRLHGYNSEDYPSRNIDLANSPFKIQPTLLLDVLHGIPQLQVLHLSNVVATAPPAESVARLLTPLRRLQISVTFLDRDTPHECRSALDITQLLDCFTEVNELHLLGEGSFKDFGDPDDFAGPTKLRVNTFILQRRFNGGVLFRHLLHASLSDVRRLILRLVTLHEGLDFERFQRVLRTIGPQLEEFRTYLEHWHYRSGIQAIDITPCRNIREFTAGFTFPIFISLQCNRVLEDLVKMLFLANISKAQFPSLRDLILQITFDAQTFRSVSDPDEDWVTQCTPLETLDTQLVNAVERCEMKGVWFECNCLGELDSSGSVARMFPQLRRRGYVLFREPRADVWQTHG